MRCPHCNRLMLKRTTGVEFLTYPPKRVYQYWCGEHGWQGEKFLVRDLSEDEIARKEWNNLNE